MRGLRLFVVMVAGAVVLLAGCAPARLQTRILPEDVLDHLLCYDLEPTQFNGPPNLSLIDQFYVSPPGPAVVISRKYLCNPVDKYHEDGSKPGKQARRRKSHLVCYELRRVRLQPPPTVLVSNQFQDAEPLAVLNSELLCLPSGKGREREAPSPIPRNIDHFKCYAVDAAGSADTPRLHLIDQFFDRHAVFFPQALLLCNPTEKVLDGRQQGPMLHNFAHLACYSLSFDDAFEPPTVRITNQFEPNGAVVTIRFERFLCVPSTKAHPPKKG